MASATTTTTTTTAAAATTTIPGTAASFSWTHGYPTIAATSDLGLLLGGFVLRVQGPFGGHNAPDHLRHN